MKLILLLALIFFAIFLIILNKSGKKDEKKQEGAVPAVIIPTPIILSAGSFLLQPVTVQESTASVQAKEFEVVANSQERSIVAFDIIITYEKGALEILSAESLLPEFDIYPLGRSNHFIITGAKKPENNETVVFNNTPIVRLKVIPKKTAIPRLRLADTLGKERSQMIDDKSNILSPDVGELKLETQ